MSRKLRHVPPNCLFELTCRTFQNRPLLQPLPSVRDLILGILGRAQRIYGLEIHALVFLSTDYHLLVTARDARQLSLFMGYVNSNVARGVGRLIGWSDRFWGRRYEAIPVSSEDAAQLSRLRYLLSNGVKEGLVVRPEDWPGAHSVDALLGVGLLEGTWIDRTRWHEARRSRKSSDAKEFATTERVVLTPLPCLQHIDAEVRRQVVRDLIDSIVEEGAALRRASGRPPLGVEAILLQEPTSRPAAVERSPAPWVHAATQAVRNQFREAYQVFSAAFRAAAERLKAGDTKAEFPPGSFPPALPWVPLQAVG
jgi:REP element-mobilizing transposase RayT